MSRTNQALALALIAQIIIGIFLFMPGDSDSGRAAGPLLAGFEPDKVTSVTIRDGNDNAVTLHKTDQGEWVLPDKDDYPAQNFRVQQLLNGLQRINRNRLIARNPSSHNRLGVGRDEYERLIEVELSEGGTRTVYLGTSAGGSAAHVRLGDEDSVYLTNELVSWEVPARLASYIDTAYFSVPREDILTLQIENPNGVFQLQKTGDAWTLVGLADGETLDPDSVTSLLGKVASVRMTEPLGKQADPAWSMDDPLVKITLTVREPVAAPEESEDTGAAASALDSLLPATATPATLEATPSPDQEGEAPSGDATEEPEPETVEKLYELKIGQKLEDNAYPVISSKSEFYVKVSASTAEAFLNLTRQDFLVAESEAEGESAPAEGTATPQAGATN